jgi:hypothetical protein
MKHLLVLTCIAALTGCGEGDGPCDEGATRCAGNTVEVCDSKREWKALADCADVSRLARRPLVCSYVPATDGGVEGNTCIPEPPPTE